MTKTEKKVLDILRQHPQGVGFFAMSRQYGVSHGRRKYEAACSLADTDLVTVTYHAPGEGIGLRLKGLDGQGR
jgi:hypothetical protein